MVLPFLSINLNEPKLIWVLLLTIVPKVTLAPGFEVTSIAVLSTTGSSLLLQLQPVANKPVVVQPNVYVDISENSLFFFMTLPLYTVLILIVISGNGYVGVVDGWSAPGYLAVNVNVPVWPTAVGAVPPAVKSTFQHLFSSS